MVRLIIDKCGNGHNDIFLKIGSIPSFEKVFDSYYLFDFLEFNQSRINKQNTKNSSILTFSVLKLLNYWIERIKSIENGQVKFIPFDLQDEYIGGLEVEK